LIRDRSKFDMKKVNKSNAHKDSLQLKTYKLKTKSALAYGLQNNFNPGTHYKGDLAKKLNKCPSEISKYFSGNHNFTINTLCEIAFVLAVPLNVLVANCNLHPNRINSYGKVAPIERAPYLSDGENDLPITMNVEGD